MEQGERRARVTGIDGIYLPVANRKRSEDWYVTYLGVDRREDYLLAGNQEIFLRERLGDETLTFRTNGWLGSGESYDMPVVCLRTSDIDGMHEQLRESGTRIGEIIVHSWFKEFDFCDPDGNKLKVWQPNA